MKKLITDIEAHLQKQILPFWLNLLDEEFGGLYGSVDENLHINKSADKSLIYISRCLWFFSVYDGLYPGNRAKAHADSCYNLLTEKFYDQEYGGMMYMLKHDGSVQDDTKHVYAISFAIYGLSAYAKTYKNDKALGKALDLYRFLQSQAFDSIKGLYWEQFSRTLQKEKNTCLSDCGAPYTYNTHLHLLEAYTALYEVSHNDDVWQSLKHLVELFKHMFYHTECHYIRAFLDENLKEVGCLYSVAHDIEASWLFQLALDALGTQDEELKKIMQELAEAAVPFVNEGHMNIAYEAGVVDNSQCWWAQAEAMVGFLYAYEESEDEKYKKLIADVYAYTKEHFFDSRPLGEWLSGECGNAYVAGPWKAPYHTGRFAMQYVAYGRRKGVI